MRLEATGQRRAIAANIACLAVSNSPQIDKPTLHLESVVH
jgi:hypothetical protein